MIRVVRYAAEHRGDWNAFLDRSRNGVFLFHRDYMDYHADRFADHSLVAYEGDRLLALFPANLHDDALVSHGGLTFGGFISDERMRTRVMLDIFNQLSQYAQGNGIRRIVSGRFWYRPGMKRAPCSPGSSRRPPLAVRGTPKLRALPPNARRS